MTSSAIKLKTKILSLSNSSDYDRACSEWEPVIHSGNSNVLLNQAGYKYKNKCHHNENDNCYCVVGTEGRTDISTITNKTKKPEHCRWVNYRNLDLFNNSNTYNSCICGEPIIYVYQIKNKQNGNLIPNGEEDCGIGCECLKKFLPNCYDKINDYAMECYKKVYANKFCLNCNKRHYRKNMLEGEVQNCKKCPQLCAILDCCNISYKKNLCIEHLFGKR